MATGVEEFLIATTYGILMTMGAYYVQTGYFALESFLNSLPVAFFISNMLLINQFCIQTAINHLFNGLLLVFAFLLNSVTWLVPIAFLAASFGLVFWVWQYIERHRSVGAYAYPTFTAQRRKTMIRILSWEAV
jgi:hypothetical protein